MAKRRGMDIVGKWAFLIGMLLAIVLGLLDIASGIGAIILVIIGLIVGLLNIGDSEVTPFLMSGAVLIIASYFGGNILVDVRYIRPVLDALLAVFVPATIIVAIKNVFSLARD